MSGEHSPYFDLVPRTPGENLKWRIAIREAAIGNAELQAAIRQACEEDTLFFFGFALWVVEPRSDKPLTPFIPWPHQEAAILALEMSLKESRMDIENLIDVVMDKSRAQGGSYIALGTAVKHYNTDDRFAVALISRNMDCVDNSNDPDSLMYKIDFMMDLLPFWLRPTGFNPPSQDKQQRSFSGHSWRNPENYATMVGYSSTGDVGSGGRKTVDIFDEVAKFDSERPGMLQEALDSTAHTTNCRWLISTHKGDSGPYYDMIFNDAWTPEGEVFALGGSGVYRNNSGGIKIVLDWRDNISQNRLAYRYNGGHFMPERYEERKEVQEYIEQIKEDGRWRKLQRGGFVKEGRLRSKWYDNRCLQKGATPRSIAQELDRDPRSTVGKMFNPEVMDEMDRLHVKPPLWQGDATIQDGKLKLVKEFDGPLKLWFPIPIDGKPPRGRYAIGIDPASGLTGGETGNSVICGGNAITGEQVLEYTIQIPETRFAHISAAIGVWLYDALLIGEAQGQNGKRFYNALIGDTEYWNIWKRANVEIKGRANKNKVNSEQIGWVNNTPAHKRDLFEDMWIAMQDGEFVPRSAEMIAECRGWEEKPSKTPGKTDIIYHGTGHGDRAIAGGLCNKGMRELASKSLDKSRNKENDVDVPYWSMAGRQQRRQEEEGEIDDEMTGFRHKLRTRW